MASVIDKNLLSEIDNYIKVHKVMIFSKSRCPYCIKVKELLTSLGVDFHALELDVIENGSLMQDAMAERVGRRSVPQVFIDGERIGGCDDTMAAHKSGKLKQLLKL